MFASLTPFCDGLSLRQRHLVIHFRIAVLRPEPEALEEFSAGRLARRRRREKYAEPQMIRILVTGAKNTVTLRGSALHTFAAARARADQNETANDIGRLQRNFLADESADRKPKHVDAGQAQRLDKGDRVRPHLFERGWYLSRRGRYAGVVEQDDFAIFGETIGHRRIPVVHRAGIVLIEDQRHAARFAEPSVGKTNAVGVDKLGGRSLMRIAGHCGLLAS